MKSVIEERRRFLTGLAGSLTILPLASPLASSLIRTSITLAKENPVRWPTLIGSPVLDSLRPVIENSRDVRTNVGKIGEVAGWMGYEELPLPEFTLPFGVGAGDAKEAIDFILVADSIDTAFTDFSTHEKFQVDFAGQHWSDSLASNERWTRENRSSMAGTWLKSPAVKLMTFSAGI
jgi:hypothetical protein